MSFKEIKAKYKIPDCYDDGMQMIDGRIVFFYCDSDITVHPNGVVEECHMGLNSDATGHEFFTVPWRS